MIVEYGPYAPDRRAFGNTCILARNVIPQAGGYGPWPSLSATTGALAAPSVGVFSFRRVNGTVERFAGTATKLYRQSGASWTDVSKGLGVYSSSTAWRFALYGDRLIATNGIDAPQAFDLASDTQFADLPGAPVHTFPIVVRDVLVAINVLDGSGLDLKFSAVNNSEKWTADCGGGGQPFPDGGPLVGGVGGEVGIIVQQNALTRMNFVGGDLRFTFDKMEGAVGCIAPGSIVQVRGAVFFLSHEGFQQFDGAQTTNISDEFVSDTFFGEVDQSALSSIVGAHDPTNSSVVWSYPISGGRKMVRYNYALQRWSDSDVSVTGLHTGMNANNEVLAAFDGTNQVGEFTGTDLSASVQTGDLQLSDGRKSFVRGVRGMVDAAHDITVGQKSALLEASTNVTVSADAVGKASMRSSGRYHSLKVVPTAAFTELSGVDIDIVSDGAR